MFEDEVRLIEEETVVDLTEEELKPCPFCGEIPYLMNRGVFTSRGGQEWGDNWVVRCSCGMGLCDDFKSRVYRDNKGKIIIESDGRAEAIKAWNRRA